MFNMCFRYNKVSKMGLMYKFYYLNGSNLFLLSRLKLINDKD